MEISEGVRQKDVAQKDSKESEKIEPRKQCRPTLSKWKRGSFSTPRSEIGKSERNLSKAVKKKRKSAQKKVESEQK